MCESHDDRTHNEGMRWVAKVDVELLIRNHEKNRSGGSYFEFNEPKHSS